MELCLRSRYVLAAPMRHKGPSERKETGRVHIEQ